MVMALLLASAALLMAAGGEEQEEGLPRVCLLPGGPAVLQAPQTLLVHTQNLTLRVVMTRCGFTHLGAAKVDLRGAPGRNLTSGLGRVLWHSVSLADEGGKAVLRIGSRVVRRTDRAKCRSVEVYFPRTSVLGRMCPENETVLPQEDPFGRRSSPASVFDLFAKYLSQRDLEAPEDPLDDPVFAEGTPPPPPPPGGSYDPPYRRNDREESVLPIFIGVLAFVVSMCVRFCLCRRKRVVTTVAVIRGLPSQDLESSGDSTLRQEHLDLPPAYSEVLGDPGCPQGSQEDLPPSYEDIEPNPPPYWDLLEVGPPSSGGEGSSSAAPAEGASVQASPQLTCGRASPFSRVLSSQYRALRTQFAFRHLQEES